MKKTLTSIMMLGAMLALAGCLTSITAKTEKRAPDGTVTTSYVSVFGTGDKVAQSAAEGLFADGTDADLGAGVKKASAKQESTGIGETLKGMGEFMGGMAKFLIATQANRPAAENALPAVIAPTPITEPEDDAASEDTDTSPTLPPETVTANSATMKVKIAEAKATGKPLVVLAGNTGCNYCTRMEAALKASPEFAARTDIVFYHEQSPWSVNQAAKWTGGGKYPVLRVTQWDSTGNVVCDKKVERPTTVATIEAALGSCQSP